MPSFSPYYPEMVPQCHHIFSKRNVIFVPSLFLDGLVSTDRHLVLPGFFSKSLFALFSASSSSFINVYPIRSSTAALRQNTILTAVDGLPYYFFPSVRALATLTTNWNFQEVHKSSRTLTVLSMALAFNMKRPSSLIPSAMYRCFDFTHPCYVRHTAIYRTCILT